MLEERQIANALIDSGSVLESRHCDRFLGAWRCSGRAMAQPAVLPKGIEEPAAKRAELEKWLAGRLDERMGTGDPRFTAAERRSVLRFHQRRAGSNLVQVHVRAVLLTIWRQKHSLRG